MTLEQKIKIGDLIKPEVLEEFKEELSQLLQKMYMEGYNKGYEDASNVAINSVKLWQELI